jgi:predicted metal-dependent hydrolase
MTNDLKRTFQHSRLGEVEFRKVPRARRIKILIRPGKNVLVTLPLYEQFTKAEQFLYEKADWVAKAVQRIKKENETRQTLFTPETEFDTYSRKVQLLPDDRVNVRVQITPETVFIYYPANRSVDDAALQSVIRKAVEHAWKVEAHEVLPQRITQLSAQHRLPYKELLIKNTVSYWGLCAPDNTITLNIHLMHLPPHLIDFIILHELCHTIHKNHGARFWELLDRLANGNARLHAKEMKKYSTRVY